LGETFEKLVPLRTLKSSAKTLTLLDAEEAGKIALARTELEF